MEVSEETLAEDVIDEVGPGGTFFGEEHTIDHLYDFWEAELLKPRTSQEWEKSGKQNMEDILNGRVKEILEKGTQHPLEPEIVKKLDEIMERAGNLASKK